MNIRIWPWLLLVLALIPALLINAPKTQIKPPAPRSTAMVEAIYQMPGNLDPALATTPADWQVIDNVFEPLLSTTPGGKIVPAAASLVTMSGNTVKVKMGTHRLSNGRVLTAFAAAGALDRAVLPPVNSTIARSLLSGVVGYRALIAGHKNFLSGIKVLNANTFTITLKHPATLAFLSNLANPALSLVPMIDQQEGGANWQFSNLIGTGGYKLSGWVPGDSLSFQRVSGTGPRGVTLSYYPSFHSALLGFVNHIVSILPVPIDQIAGLKHTLQRRVQFLPTPGTLSLYLGSTSHGVGAYPALAPVSAWVHDTFAGREASAGQNWPSGLPSGHPMTVWVNSHDTAAVSLAKTLAKLTKGKVTVKLGTSSQIHSQAVGGTISAYLGTKAWFKGGTSLRLARRGNFWLWRSNITGAQAFANGALNWHTITLRN